MSDVCMHAHSVISMAYDGEHVTSEDLRTAKSHCATCPECAAFVSGLARIRNVPAPRATEGVIDRAMVAVKHAADTQAAQAAKAERDAAEGIADVVALPTTTRRLASSWTTWGGWAAAAAVILVAVGVVTVNGVRYMSTPAQKATSDASMVENQAELASPPSNGAASAPAADSTLGRSAATIPAPDYVVFQGFVYVVEENPDRLASDATPIGSVRSDLGSGEVLERQVFPGDSPGDIIVAESSTEGYAASALVRRFGRASFGLQAPDILQFGQWPQLPGGLTQPTSADGSPIFEENDEDDAGVPIYVLPGSEPDAGFAVGANTSPDDPAGGNPGWTWWAPLQ